MRPSTYKGTKPYVFISYAHKDTDRVFEILRELEAKQIRIWYDEGIAPGSEWPEDVAQHLYNAGLVMAFISPNSMASENCRREINFSLSKRKPFLSVVLEETQMPLGMEMQLSAKQSILRYNYTTWDAFIEKILKCPDLEPCREGGAAAPNEAPPAPVADAVSQAEREAGVYALFEEAKAHAAKGDYVQELQTLIKCLSLAPDNSEVYNRIGRAYRRLGNNAKALEYYEKARELTPDVYWIVTNIGLVYFFSGEYEKARKYLEQGIAMMEKDPRDSSSYEIGANYANYGFCLGRLGDMNGAKKYLRMAKEKGYAQDILENICSQLHLSPKVLEKRFRLFG